MTPPATANTPGPGGRWPILYLFILCHDQYLTKKLFAYKQQIRLYPTDRPPSGLQSLKMIRVHPKNAKCRPPWEADPGFVL